LDLIAPFCDNKQHFLCFLPLPQGHGVFRPIFVIEEMFQFLPFRVYFIFWRKEKILQLRFATNHTVDQYIKDKAWKDAVLDHCPLHPQGGCKFASHGTYSRKFPDGAKVARWYCPDGCTTFSMLPD